MAAINTSRFDLSPQNELLISRVIQERKANHVIVVLSFLHITPCVEG